MDVLNLNSMHTNCDCEKRRFVSVSVYINSKYNLLYVYIVKVIYSATREGKNISRYREAFDHFLDDDQ